MEIRVAGRGIVLIPFTWINETELLPLHKLPDPENTNKLVPLFLNAVKVHGDKLLRLVVTSKKNQEQFIKILAYSTNLDNLKGKEELLTWKLLLSEVILP